MAKEITGIGGRSGVSSTALNNINLENKNKLFQLVKVVDIILDSSHLKFKESGGFSSIGAIFYSNISNTDVISSTAMALPFDATIKQYPLVDEFVLIINLQGEMGIQDNKVFYLKPLSLYNTLNHNAFPSIPFSPPINKSKNYQNNINDNTQIEQNEPQPLTPKFNSSLSTPSNPFIEQNNIRTLTPSSGDVIIEGRNGQSIRFSNDKGNPFTFIRNGQDKTTPSSGFGSIVESIRNDLSSIYLTSTQQLKDFKVAGNENYNAFPLPIQPIPPSLYNKPQIAINSNRIVIDAQEDSILLSAKNTLSVSVENSVGITTPAFYVGSNKIRLGGNDAKEPILKGNVTVSLLKSLVESVKELAGILEVETNWPKGKKITSNNSVAANTKSILTDLLNQLNLNETDPETSSNCLKSNTSKVK